MDYDRTKPKIYDEKCNVQMLTLVPQNIKDKAKLLAEKQGTTVSQVIRNLLEESFKKNGI